MIHSGAKKWHVETLDGRVDAELSRLPAKVRARLARIVELIESLGIENVGEPHVRHLDGKLWEIRAKAPEGIGRAIYLARSGRRIVILHAFAKKTQKTPKRHLDTAIERMKEL